MLQAPQFDRLSLDPFSLQQDGLAAPEVDVGGGEIVEAFVIAPMVVALDEGCDLGFEITRQEVVFEQDAVLYCLVPPLDLALGLGMARCPTGVFHFSIPKPAGQLTSDVTRPIVGKQARPLSHGRLIAA
jgi:hypothetical protein